MAYFGLIVVSFGVFHAVLFVVGPRVRQLWIVRVTPHPVVMALGATATAFIPVACTIDGSLVDNKLDKYALLCTCFFTVQFSFTQLAMLPAYEYMLVHTCLSIMSTIVLSLTSNAGKLRPWWIGLTTIANAIYLAIHHWFTTMHPIVVDPQEVVIDARPPNDQEIGNRKFDPVTLLDAEN